MSTRGIARFCGEIKYGNFRLSTITIEQPEKWTVTVALWRRTSVTMVAALAGLLPARLSLGQAPATAPAATRRSTPTPGAVLLSRSSTQPQRDEAARRILASPINDARGIFLAALRDGGHDAQLAVARALADSTRVDPEFVDPLGSLIGGERNLHEAAARALARLKHRPGGARQASGVCAMSTSRRAYGQRSFAHARASSINRSRSR